MVKQGQTHWRLDAGDDRRGGGLRKTPTGDHLRGGEALRDEETRPRLVVVVFGLGVVRKDAGDDVGGCRSSCELGVVARRHGRRSWWWLRATEVAVSTTVGSGASCGGCGHGHAMAGGEKLSAAVDNLATARERRNREGETDGELT